MLLGRIPLGNATLRGTLRRMEETVKTTRFVLSTEQIRECGAYMSALYGDGNLGCFCLTAVDDPCFLGGSFHAKDTRGGYGMYGMTVGQDVQELEQPEIKRHAPEEEGLIYV